MRLNELTWPEVKEYLERSPHKALLVPIGTCEQHSKHLPLNTDTIVAELIADELSRETGILVAPTQNYGVNLPADKGLCGTCSLSEETLRTTLKEIIEWWSLQGFKKFLVVSAHGDPMHIKALVESSPSRVLVLELYDFEMGDILESQTRVKHACEGETSVMLYLFPEKVRRKEIQDHELPDEEMRAYLFRKKEGPIPDTPGGEGKPSKATFEKGREIYFRMLERALKWVLDNIPAEAV